MRHCFGVRTREDPLSWYIVADCLQPRYQMKTRSRLTKKRARGLDVRAHFNTGLQSLQSVKRNCRHNFLSAKNNEYWFFQALIQKLLKGRFVYMWCFVFLVSLLEGWGGGGLKQLHYKNLIRSKFLQGRRLFITHAPTSSLDPLIFPQCFIPDPYCVAVLQDFFFNTIFVQANANFHLK